MTSAMSRDHRFPIPPPSSGTALNVLRGMLVQSDSLSLAPVSRVSERPRSTHSNPEPAAERRPKILHAARDPMRACDIAQLLSVDGYDMAYALGTDDLFESLVSSAPELLLVDDDFQNLDVAGLCSQIHALAAAHPPRIVFLCAGDPEEQATASALLAGVEDYVSAERGTELRARIRVALRRNGQFLTLARLRRERNELHSLAYVDTLTGVPNRRSFNAMLELLERRAESFAILFVDIDHFKSINDRFGHAVGDIVLRCVAGVLKECLHPEDFLCRYGGEEFVVLARQTSNAGELAERLRSRVARLSFNGAERLRVTISVGVDTFVPGGRCASQVLAGADASLYVAKQSGRNRSAVAGELLRIL